MYTNRNFGFWIFDFGLTAPAQSTLQNLKSKISLRGLLALLGLVVWQTSAWAFGSPGVKIWFPEGVSTYAPQIDRLFMIILVITGVIFLGVEAALLWFLIRYRHRPGRTAAYTHGNVKAEIVSRNLRSTSTGSRPLTMLIWFAASFTASLSLIAWASDGAVESDANIAAAEARTSQPRA